MTVTKISLYCILKKKLMLNKKLFRAQNYYFSGKALVTLYPSFNLFVWAECDTQLYRTFENIKYHLRTHVKVYSFYYYKYF